MRNVLTSMRFMLFWILGSVLALYGTVVLTIIILFASSLVAAFIFIKHRGDAIIRDHQDVCRLGSRT